VTFLGLACASAIAGSQLGLDASLPPDAVETAIDHLWNLEYDQARPQLEAWLAQHPNDLRAMNYLASTMLQREMFQRELLEGRMYVVGGEAFRKGRPPVPAGFQGELFGVLNRAESLAQERLRQNSRDEDALYWLGAAHAIRAIFHLTFARAPAAALREAKEARNYHARVLSLNPGFVDAMLFGGMYEYVVGSLPWYMKFLASIAGYRGDRERGLAAMQRVAREGHRARMEARQFLVIVYFREKRYPEALALLQEMERAYPRNFVIPQEIARVYKGLGDWRAAAETYQQLLARHHQGAPGYRNLPVSKILYQAGEAYARMGDTAQALRLYKQVEERQEDNIFVYRAALAAGNMYQQQNRPEDARRRYERVASAIPSTEEGRAARQYLKQLR